MNASRLSQLKGLDLSGQLIAPIITIVMGRNLSADSPISFYCGLFVVGGWQLISFTATLFTAHEANYWKSPQRRWYMGFVIAFGVLAIAATQGEDALAALLFGAPLLAIWYVGITAAELVRLRRLCEFNRGNPLSAP